MASDFPSSRAAQRLAGLVPGTLIGGYRIEGRIGAGGMAVVFRAREESLGRPVALKVLVPELAADAEFRERFVHESRVASAVDHPNIIPVHAAGGDAGVLYLAMRYVAGGDLHSLVEREGPLPPERALSLLIPIASALDAAHGAGIVHRDVKPANVLIDSSPGRPDHPYLSDFGLAKRPALPGRTAAGEFVGTAGFASPEQLAGRMVSPQTDQYGLACVAYLVLAAAMPFQSGDPQAALWAQMSNPPPRVTDQRRDLAPDVDRVIARALAREPEQRYASCGEFAAELGRALTSPTRDIRTSVNDAGLPRRRPAGLEPISASAHAFAPVSARETAAPANPRAAIPPPTALTTRYEPDRRPRRRGMVIGAGVAAVAAVAAVAVLVSSRTDSPPPSRSGARARAQASATGAAALLSVLKDGGGRDQGIVTEGFGASGTLTLIDRAGAVTTYNEVSQRALAHSSLAAGSPGAARLSLDGAMTVAPGASCGPCAYKVSGLDGRSSQTITGGKGPVYSTGNSTMADRDIRGDGIDVWNLRSGLALATGLADPDRGPVQATAIDPSGEAAAVSSGAAGSSHRVYWWTVSSRSVVATLTVARGMGAPGPRPGGAGLPIGLTGQTLAVSDGQGTDIYRAPPDQPTRAKMTPVTGGLLAVSPNDGNLVATRDQANVDRVDIWDARTGQQTAALTLPSASPTSVAFSPDGKTVAVGDSSGTVYVWTITGAH